MKANKNPQIVSLGSGCDVALAMLEPNELMQQTHFFDYLWNLDRGLEIVQSILEEDFAGFSTLADFVQDYHPEWNTEPSETGITLGCGNLQSTQLVHRKFRDLAFIHYQHDQDLIDTLSRKIQRFRHLLEGDEPVNFVYYRSFEAAIDGEYYNDDDYDIDEKLVHFKHETQSFVTFLSRSYPHLTFHLWAIFLEPIETVVGVNDKIDAFIVETTDSNGLSFHKAKRRGPGCRPSWNLILDEITSSQSVLFSK